MDEYVERVGRVLETDVQLREVETAPQLPRRRERTREIPRINVGMLDFLGLYGCELQHVVGERNSILGRVMHPSSALNYEVRFLRAAEDCMEEIERERLKERLEEVIEVKRGTMPDAVWNAIWASREIENLFTRSRGPLPVDHSRDLTSGMLSDVRLVQDSIDRILEGDPDVDVDAMDPVYQRWNRQALIGQTVRSALLISARLNDAAEIVEARLDGRPVCHDQNVTQQAEHMQNMFMSVFAGHVQPYLAEVQNVRNTVLPAVRELSNLGEVERNAAVHDYLGKVLDDQHEDSVWRAFDEAIERHTEAWQQLLEQCDMSPALRGS